MANEGFMDFFQNKESEEEQSIDESSDESTSPSVGLFDFLNDITTHKKGDLLTANTKGEFNKFMILRFLACDPDLIKLVEHVEPYQSVLSESQLYELLIALIPQKKRYLKYRVKGNNQPSNEAVEKMVEQFEVSRDDAYKYVQLLDENEQQCFIRSFGGKIE